MLESLSFHLSYNGFSVVLIFLSQVLRQQKVNHRVMHCNHSLIADTGIKLNCLVKLCRHTSQTKCPQRLTTSSHTASISLTGSQCHPSDVSFLNVQVFGATSEAVTYCFLTIPMYTRSFYAIFRIHNKNSLLMMFYIPHRCITELV